MNLKITFKQLVILLSISTFLFSALSTPIKAELQKNEKVLEPFKQRTLTFVSDSILETPPNIAIISIHFVGYGWSVSGAKKKLDDLLQKFQEKIAKEEIKPTKIRIGDLKLKPSYQFNRDLKTHVASDFIVSRKIILEFENFNQIPKLMDLSISLGSFEIDQAYYSVQDKIEFEKKSFEHAIQQATEKAQTLAKTLNSELGKILHLEQLHYQINELHFIQDQLFNNTENSTSNEANAEDPKTTPNLPSNETLTSLTPTDNIQSRTQLKITFSIE